MNQKIKISQLGFSCLLLISIALISCEKEPEKERESPALPPTNVLLETFSQLSENKDSLGSNYQYALDQITGWNQYLSSGLSIPIASWKEIREVEPIWDADSKVWIWNVEFNNTEGNYTANLHGWKDDKQYKWRMYISHQGLFEDFLWYTGNSRTDSTYGIWRVYNSYRVDEPYIDIEWWNRENSNLDSIKYTRVGPLDVRNGSSMKFGRFENLEEKDEVYFDLYDALNERNLSIWVEEESEIGGVRSQSQFGDNLYRCWGEDAQNVQCDTLI